MVIARDNGGAMVKKGKIASKGSQEEAGKMYRDILLADPGKLNQ